MTINTSILNMATNTSAAALATAQPEYAAVRDAVLAEFSGEYETARKTLRDAAEAHDTAKSGSFTARAEMARRLAKLAHAGKWSPAAIDQGLDEAIIQYCRGSNGLTPKSLANVKTELKRALSPSVRGRIDEIYETARAAWKSEEGKPDNMQPLRNDFEREYHLIQRGFMGALAPSEAEIKKGAVSHMPTVAELTAKSVAKAAVKASPETRAKAAVAKIVKTVKALADEFPGAATDAMVKFASGLNAADMLAPKAAEAAMAAETAARAAAPAPAAPAPATVLQPAPATRRRRNTAPAAPAPAAPAPATRRRRNAAPAAADVGNAIEETLTGISGK